MIFWAFIVKINDNVNTKDLIITIRGRLNLQSPEAEKLFEATVNILKDEFANNNTVSVPSFGQFEIKKKNERISVNPSTQERMLVPPKLSLSFKPSSTLKERYNKPLENE